MLIPRLKVRNFSEDGIFYVKGLQELSKSYQPSIILILK